VFEVLKAEEIGRHGTEGSRMLRKRQDAELHFKKVQGMQIGGRKERKTPKAREKR